MKKLVRNIWEGKPSTLAAALIAGIGGLLCNDVDLPKSAIAALSALAAFLAAFDGPNKTK